MKLIAGLGNPGRRYAGTRHNAGYAVVEALARRWQADVSRYESRFQGQVGEAQVGEQPVRLLLPTTYMNLSGGSVGAMLRFYKLPVADLLVISDDLDLPLGKLRLRQRGSAGGQKGLADIIRNLGDEEFCRLRLGIGSVHKSATVEHVLSPVDRQDRELFELTIERAADAADCWVRRGIDAAMNQYNPGSTHERGAGGKNAASDR